jgi:hypothetical protein
MSPATLLFGVLLGMLIVAPVAYFLGKDAAFAEFKLDQLPPLLTNEGLVRKKFYVTLQERLIYKGIPLPWWTTKIPVGEKLDEASLTALAKAASIVASISMQPADLKGLVMKIIARLLPKTVEKDATTLQEEQHEARPSRQSDPRQ